MMIHPFRFIPDSQVSSLTLHQPLTFNPHSSPTYNQRKARQARRALHAAGGRHPFRRS